MLLSINNRSESLPARIKMVQIAADIILSVLFVATVIRIWSYSFESVAESSETSMRVVKQVLVIIDPNERLSPAAVGTLHSVIRKIAHFSEYASVAVEFGLLSFSLSLNFILVRKTSFVVAPILGFCIGAIDETIQRFTGRGAAIRDVMIDFTGFVFGYLIISLIIYLLYSLCVSLRLRGERRARFAYFRN